MGLNTRTDMYPTSSERRGNDSFDPAFAVNMVEPLGYDGQNLQRMNASALAVNVDYVAGANPIYVGKAAPGTATSAALWQIQKLTYDVSNNVTAVAYAGGTPNFNQIWDNRAVLSYS